MEKPKPGPLGAALLIGWNLICIAVPLALFFQPSPEPSIARAVVLVFFAGPAAVLAFAANAGVLWRYRGSRLALGLTALSGVAVLVWLVALIQS